jgi:alpha-ketoglutarate-dependent taurine dioxygenase
LPRRAARLTASGDGIMYQINRIGEALGAEVIGLDPSAELTGDDTSSLNEAFFDHLLLCIRCDPMSAEDFARFGRQFGDPQLQLLRKRRHGEVPEVSMLESTYKSEEDKPNDMQTMRLTGWHTDDSYFAAPAKATMFQSLKIPDAGGQTRFCNMRQAYDDLPDATKARLGGLKAVHSYDTLRTSARAAPRNAVEAEETPDVIHPLIRTHEDTGRKAIYINSNRTDRIVDMDRAESDALLDELFEHVTQPKYQYHHEWRVGDILLWDNRCLMHSVNMDFPVGQPRLHQRLLLEGATPV